MPLLLASCTQHTFPFSARFFSPRITIMCTGFLWFSHRFLGISFLFPRTFSHVHNFSRCLMHYKSRYIKFYPPHTLTPSLTAPSTSLHAAFPTFYTPINHIILYSPPLHVFRFRNRLAAFPPLPIFPVFFPDRRRPAIETIRNRCKNHGKTVYVTVMRGEKKTAWKQMRK